MSFATVDKFEVAAQCAPADGAKQPLQQDVANAAHVLVSQFATPESTQSRTRAIWDMATRLTVGEFSTAMEKALEQAKANDKAAGFTPAADAKGRDKYGPMQSTLATVASQCRQVFGACKIDPESIVSATPDGAVVNSDLFPNWSKAYEKARAFLADKGVDWTGNKLDDVKAARKNKAKTAEDAGVLAEVMGKFPHMPGESMADYMARIADDVEAAQKTASHALLVENAKKELTRLIKVYGEAMSDVLEEMVLQNNALADAQEAPF